jgi:hypothetical protein
MKAAFTALSVGVMQMLKPDCADHGINTQFCTDACDLVWDIFENAWVTRDYWNWVNQQGKYRVKTSAGGTNAR